MTTDEPVSAALAAFRAEVERRVGKAFEEPRPFRFDNNGDRYGWVEGEDGRHHLTLYVPSGRIKDIEGGPQFLSGLRRIAEVHGGTLRYGREPPQGGPPAAPDASPLTTFTLVLPEVLP